MLVDDLRSVGYAALLDAARTFDPGRAEFRAYASKRIRWALLDACRRETHSRTEAVRLASLTASERYGETLAPLPHGDEPGVVGEEAERARLRQILAGHAAALALGLVVPAGALDERIDHAGDAEERLARLELGAALRRQVARLPDRERALVLRHYFDGEPFDAIAASLGISKSWASRLHAQAIRALAGAMAEPERS